MAISFLSYLKLFWNRIKALDRKSLELMSIRGRGDGDDDDDDDEGTLEDGEIKQPTKNNSFDLINYINSELSYRSSRSIVDRADGDQQQMEGLQMHEVSMEDLVDQSLT